MALHEEDGVPFGKIRFGGVTRSVCLSCLPEVVVGDYVLVHVGFAISRLDAGEAARTYDLLRELAGEEEGLS